MQAPPTRSVARRAAAVMEVLGIYLAGGVMTDLLVDALHVRPTNPLAKFRVDITDSQLLSASWDFTVLLLFQYAGWFLLIVPINAWHRRRGRAAYGLTRAGHAWTALALAGFGTAALAAWPVLGLNLLDTFYNLGDTVPWRQAMFDTSWRRWEFWLFMGVASWGLVAWLEELFFRGYCQRRLAEEWGHGPAIVGVSCLFVFAHSQYLSLSAYDLGMVVSLGCLSIGFGVVFAATGSIVPSFLAHALINIPLTPLGQAIGGVLCVVGSFVAWRPGRERLRQVFASARPTSCVLLGLVGAGWAIASRQFGALPYVAVGLVLIAIGLHALERRRNSRAASAEPMDVRVKV